MQSGSEKKAVVFYCAAAELQRSAFSGQRSVVSGRCAVSIVFYLLFSILGLLFSAGYARGDFVRVDLYGEVISVIDPAGLLGGRVSFLDEITGFYRFDTSTPDGKPLNGNEGEYQQTTPGCGISLNINGMLVTSEPENMNFLIKVINDTGGKDSYLLSSTVNLPTAGGLEISSIRWQLDDLTSSALSSDALVGATPGQWGPNIFEINFRGAGGGGQIEAMITYTESVPEPASAAMMSIGAGILILMRRRQRVNLTRRYGG